MRIAVVDPKPEYGGGSEQICLDLARGLATREHTVFLLHSLPGTMLPQYSQFCAEVNRVPFRPFGWRSLINCMRVVQHVTARLRAWRVDVVLCSEVHYIRLLALIRCVSDIPVVFHLGLPAHAPMRSKRWAYQRMAAGVSPSEHTRLTWERDGWPVEQLHVISNWVDVSRFRPTACRKQLRKQLGLPPTGHIICFVGRLVPEKGIDTLLTAFGQILSHQHDAHLVVVGATPDGTTGAWPERARRLGLPVDRVCFTGRRTNSQDYLAAADVATVPSEWDEPFGLTALEAMACGTPPVVTKAGILAEIVGSDNVHLAVPQKSPDRLADAIMRLLNDEAMRNTLSLALSVRAQQFSMQAGVAAYESILAQTVRDRQDPPQGTTAARNDRLVNEAFTSE